ncbi:uncharacterized protein LOC111901261 [Lactuca sativa]|uniref:J domain-containing protein n=1 Tax=Lactuca sativa TaxID=4236 RepID=A0A9R1W1H1_LACSA|nr:uncharacterized protein LOC111901261 [Lactuca sativa]KAJ0215414.1 hypothetical protein LSAT_V11C300143850 [Lactuca sativa]
MKALRRCRNNLEADNVVLIDVDTYNFNNVIDIDLLEKLTKKRGGGSSGLTNDKNPLSRTYIYIDEDDDDDEIPSETKFENVASSSSRRYDPGDEENISPLKLSSKGKRTYGLSIESDEDDEDEHIDCELMEDSSGKLREEWERAFLKRKGDVHNDDYGNVNKNKQKQGQDSSAEGKCPVGNEDGIPCGMFDVECGPGVKTNQDQFGESDEIACGCACSGNDNEEESDDVSVENSIIDQREKLKQTDEYKRALEQELSARQIALKIQAEEAQQLRRLQKRRKAESLRLLDMERRQKQRVEEIRQTQKKDEENMNLKEQYRTEVREELQRLEIMCPDMASLLRGLGIQVGEGPCPLSNEVRAAYKRALLSFHPDRASGSDMRHQVEAEEKFKLISRMKEKFSL